MHHLLSTTRGLTAPFSAFYITKRLYLFEKHVTKVHSLEKVKGPVGLFFTYLKPILNKNHAKNKLKKTFAIFFLMKNN